MAKPSKQKVENTPTETKPTKDSFYEAMPATWGSYPFADTEVSSDSFADDQNESTDYERTTKVTAIITLVLTVLVAIALTILFISGIDTINNSAPSQSDSSSSLEM